MFDERIKKIIQHVWPVPVILFFWLVQPYSWQESAMDRCSDLFFRIRGDRSCDNRLLLVYVGSEDLKALGGWPITRDYYGYFMHIMQEKQASVIAPDLLFSEQDKQYREYDDILMHYMQTGPPVVLPMVFSRFSKPISGAQHSYMADLPIWPCASFRNSAKGLGFSNLVEASVVYRLPLTAQYHDTTMLSFAAEIARTWYGGRPLRRDGQQLVFTDQQNKSHSIFLNRYGELRLNHVNLNIPSISLVELMHAYNHASDSLQIKDKLVLLAVTAPGQAQLKSTPGGATLSASLLHATVTENIISNRYLRPWPWWLTFALMAALSVFPIILSASRLRYKWLWISSLPILYFIVSYAIFIFLNGIVELWLPYIGWTVATAWILWRTWQENQEHAHEQSRLWQEQIELKSKQLQTLDAQIVSETQEAKQLSVDHARLLQEKAEAVLALEKHIRDLQQAEQPQTSPNSYNLVYAPKGKMAQVLATIEKISHNDISVLITGETGTGKELIARAIHQAGPRHKAPFLAVNCGALSETLLESELFGHEKGSFTGALARRRGVFELANNGTLFLDEISETSPALQAKLLRVLQEKVLYRVGGEQAIQVEVRVIAASNRDVKEMVHRNQFRPDLYYRLDGFSISLPALRERQEDIHLLADHFLHKHGYTNVNGFSEQVLELFKLYAWPGNVRELENVVRRSALLAESENRGLVQVADIPAEISKAEAVIAPVYHTIDAQILELLRKFRFSRDAISQTARALGKKDRGTITEYFRGLCFEHLAGCAYNLDAAAASLAATTDKAVRQAVRDKLEEYVANVKKWPGDESALQNGTASPLRGLPKKYHAVFQQVWLACKENRIT
jgi:transcriptional regulator with GAF, ATPase, and Fis domain/CHASE2 domain-containing sensor protein